eukprot:3829395-Amphidinium_carterae.1
MSVDHQESVSRANSSSLQVSIGVHVTPRTVACTCLPVGETSDAPTNLQDFQQSPLANGSPVDGRPATSIPAPL